MKASQKAQYFAIASAGAILFVLLVQAAAQADCGKSEFNYLIPKAQAAEAMPVTLDNVLQANPINLVPAPREMAVLNVNWTVSLCPDEPRLTDIALSNVAWLWRTAIIGQTEVVWVRAIQAGQTTTPTACTTIERAGMRSALAAGWGRISSAENYEYDPTMKAAYFADVKHSPEYNHVTTLFTTVAHEASMTLPPIDSDTHVWLRSYQQAAITAKAHEPEGVNCFILGPARKRR